MPELDFAGHSGENSTMGTSIAGRNSPISEISEGQRRAPLGKLIFVVVLWGINFFHRSTLFKIGAHSPKSENELVFLQRLGDGCVESTCEVASTWNTQDQMEATLDVDSINPAAKPCESTSAFARLQ